MNHVKTALSMALGFGLALTLVSFVSALNRLYQIQKPAPTGFGSTNPMESTSTRYLFRSDPATQNDLGGVSHVSPNTSINWRSEYLPDSEGASVSSVLEAVKDRMSFLQSTPQASDTNARALFALQKALDTLDGRSDLTDSILGNKP